MAPADGPPTQGPLVGVVGWPQETNEGIVSAWRQLGVPVDLLAPEEARTKLAAGDVALGRLDVLRTLDGVEPGLEVLDALAGGGVRVLNSRRSLLDAHDKLRTAELLVRAGIPHPRTVHHPAASDRLELPPPLVVKPRFGSWGVDVFRCESEEEVERVLREIANRPWFVRHGALLQELVPPVGFDLRLVVAGDEVIGAAQRVARPGEWRTNVSLGASRHPAEPAPEALALGIAAAKTIGADLVGVDLLPVAGGHVVLELNGAVEFDGAYDLPGSAAGVFQAAASALGLPIPGASPRPAPPRVTSRR
jgi:RimK family alpha-L-glutamate ligase